MRLAKVYSNRQDNVPVVRDVALLRLRDGQGEVHLVSARLTEADFDASRVPLKEGSKAGDR